jgi:hypothetical protein
MKALLQYARDLLLCRRGPQELPYSYALTAVLFAAAVAADLVLEAVVLDEPSVLGRVALADGLMLVLPYLALAVAGRQARYLQTLAAISILSIAFAVMLAPVLLLQGPAEPKAPITDVQRFAALLWLGMMSWQVLTQGHVLRHALETSLAVGVLVSLAFVTVSLAVGMSVFPPTP